jgi:DNA-binding NarL/FixJ family response regulator
MINADLDSFLPTRVLVASGNRLFAETLMLTLEVDPLLEPVGYALDPWESLQLTSELEPDVLVAADVPAIDTVTLARLTHELAPTVRIIVLAETLAPSEVEGAYAAGVADYLPSDRSASDLLAAIEGACVRQARFERSAARRAPHGEPSPLWDRAEV